MSARVPDVTVVIAVYNTMPYLTECLKSVLGQTIGVDRLEVVAVNDGSTDDSPAELNRWADRYPGTVKVLHQENSGGPAGPSNRALDVATGRYVFFLGADDHLGKEALERLVRTADELDADIVLGRMVGTGGRVVNQAVYRPGNRDDIDLVNSALPWALSNTKLFRRSLLEEHHIRYPEELRSGSDQPLQRLGAEVVVGAEEEDVPAGGQVQAAVARARRTAGILLVQHLERARILRRPAVQLGAAAVGGPVVDGDDLQPVDPDALIDQRAQALRQVRHRVVHGHHHTDVGSAHHYLFLSAALAGDARCSGVYDTRTRRVVPDAGTPSFPRGFPAVNSGHVSSASEP